MLYDLLDLRLIYSSFSFGYVISPAMLTSDVIWFGWLYYVNPVSYAFEAVMANEFAGRVMECAPNMLVPSRDQVQIRVIRAVR